MSNSYLCVHISDDMYLILFYYLILFLSLHGFDYFHFSLHLCPLSRCLFPSRPQSFSQSSSTHLCSFLQVCLSHIYLSFSFPYPSVGCCQLPSKPFQARHPHLLRNLLPEDILISFTSPTTTTTITAAITTTTLQLLPWPQFPQTPSYLSKYWRFSLHSLVTIPLIHFLNSFHD